MINRNGYATGVCNTDAYFPFPVTRFLVLIAYFPFFGNLLFRPACAGHSDYTRVAKLYGLRHNVFASRGSHLSGLQGPPCMIKMAGVSGISIDQHAGKDIAGAGRSSGPHLSDLLQQSLRQLST